jgi:hypothetical protein
MAHPSMKKDDPMHWRQLAHDARAAADQLPDPETKKTLLEIADGYEQLALIAEKKMAPSALALFAGRCNVGC